jgi:hypothetical protein
MKTIKYVVVICILLIVLVWMFTVNNLARIYSLESAIRILESGGAVSGSTEGLFLPRKSYGFTDAISGESFAVRLGRDDKGVLLLYSWSPKDNSQSLENPWHHFAAHYLPSTGNDKWYFCDTNLMMRYLKLSINSAEITKAEREN